MRATFRPRGPQSTLPTFLVFPALLRRERFSPAGRLCYNIAMRNLESAVGKIHRTDALAFMRELPDASFDLVVCDGPYAVTTHAWDNVPDIQHFNLQLLKSFSRLLKPGGAARQPCLT